MKKQVRLGQIVELFFFNNITCYRRPGPAKSNPNQREKPPTMDTESTPKPSSVHATTTKQLSAVYPPANDPKFHIPPADDLPDTANAGTRQSPIYSNT